jgi:hypothetical protein
MRTVMRGSPAEVAAISTQDAFLQSNMKGKDMEQMCRSLRLAEPDSSS